MGRGYINQHPVGVPHVLRALRVARPTLRHSWATVTRRKGTYGVSKKTKKTKKSRPNITAAHQPPGAAAGTPPFPPLAQVVAEKMKTQPMLIVCGLVGLRPQTEAERRELLSTVNLLDAVRQVADAQSNFDVANSISGTVKHTDLQFLATASAKWVERVRRRINKQDHLLSPRATAQLLREIIESASLEATAPAMDRSTLVHLLLSITSEQSTRPEFGDDVPSGSEIEQLSNIVEQFDMAQTMAYAAKLLPEIIASSLFNQPSKLEILLSNTSDMWFHPWPARSNVNGLAPSPREAFSAAVGVSLNEVIAIGCIIADENKRSHRTTFTREYLISAGASTAAVEFLFAKTALTIDEFRAAFAAERAKGPVGHQRYAFTQHPFLAVDDETLLLLRYQWSIDRLCGSLLYFEAWAGIRGSQGSKAATRLKFAFSDVFEDNVGKTLNRIADGSKIIQRVVAEPEMQQTWTEKKGETPSVCDWALLAGQHCIVVDATDHSVKAEVAQGLAPFDVYRSDIEDTFTNHKFEQLVSTMDRLVEEGGFGGESVDSNTIFIPLIVVPDAGIPDNPLIQADLTERSRLKLQHLQPRVYPPGVIQLSDLQLIEGISELARGDVVEFLGAWRTAAFKEGDGVQTLLLKNGLPLPMSRYIRQTSRDVRAEVGVQ